MELLFFLFILSLCIILKKSKETFSGDNKHYYNRFFRFKTYNNVDNETHNNTNSGFTVENLANDCATLTKNLIQRHDRGDDIHDLVIQTNNICKGQKNYIDKLLIKNEKKYIV